MPHTVKLGNNEQFDTDQIFLLKPGSYVCQNYQFYLRICSLKQSFNYTKKFRAFPS
jgi:hypothetical protein